jgi:hypothetical protein
MNQGLVLLPKSHMDDHFKQPKDFAAKLQVDSWMYHIDELTKLLKEKDQMIKLLCDDWAYDDTRIKEMCEPIVGKDFVDGDGYSFVSMLDVVEENVKKYNIISARCEEFARNLYRVRKERNELRKEIEDDNSELDTAWSKVVELQKWKDAALVVINQWNEVSDYINKKGNAEDIGKSIPETCLKYLKKSIDG